MLRHLALTFLFFANFAMAFAATNAFAAAEAFSLSGQPRQGGLMFGKAPVGSKITLDKTQVMVGKQGDFVIGFGRDAEPKAVLKVELPGGKVIRKQFDVAQREYNIQRIDGLPKRKVTPRSKADLKRIRDDSVAIGKARKLRDDRADFANGFIWPATGRISGVYGSQRVLNGKPRRPHFGVDIARPTGTPVVAPADAVVTLAEPNMFFSGGTLFMDHGHGLSSAFLHLSKLSVKVGDRVKQGDVVGEIGATGRVTGPHLDWRMNWLNRRVDPQLLVPPMPKS